LEKRPEDRPQAVELLRALEAPPASKVPEVRHERNVAMGDAGVNPKSTSKPLIPPSPRRVGRPLAALWSRLPWPGHPFRRGALVGGLFGLAVAGLLLFTTTAPGRAVVWGLGNAAIAVDRASSEGAHAVAWLSSEWFRRVGMFKYSRGNRHEAHENFKIAVAVTPWRAEPNFNLAVSCMDQGADREACHYLRRAIDLCRPNERALWQMAVSARERWGCSRGPVR
jgi:tetratricopeptide (TPR) repeat protein